MSNEIGATYTIPWDIGRQYQFRGIEKHTRRSRKNIYKGHFVDTAPAGLRPNVPYCVKIIHVKSQKLDAPQNREYFDLVDFQGDHLRQILAWNPAAEACVDSLRKTGTCGNAENCIIVEPLLEPCDRLFKNCSKQACHLRLDAMWQFAKGCEELTKDENKLGPYYIQAHRDLKRDNILMQLLAEKPRYRIIDFASVRLNKEYPVPTKNDVLVDPGETFHSAMSADNTAPEDLDGSPFRVSGKTDVYALGMMLAELFVTIQDSPSNNPNIPWVLLHGWDKKYPQTTVCNLNRSFGEMLEKYEPTAAWDNTWIEQDLAACGRRVQWESMADQTVLNSIRKLFFDSTRIDPAKRINLPQFIERLEEIIRMEKRSTSRIPVSVYLFDQTSFNRHLSSYRRAARTAMEQEKVVRGEASAALCVAFRRSLPTDKTWQDAIVAMSNGPISSPDQLEAALQRCGTRNGTGQSALLHTLNYCTQQILDLLSPADSPYTFTGMIHLFSPEIPPLDSIAPIVFNGQSIDLMSYSSMMNMTFEGTLLRIFLYTSAAPNLFTEDPLWYTYFPLDGPTDMEDYRIDQTPLQSQSGVSVPPAAHGDEKRLSFYDGTYDYYIEFDDGSKGFIGMK